MRSQFLNIYGNKIWVSSLLDRYFLLMFEKHSIFQNPAMSPIELEIADC